MPDPYIAQLGRISGAMLSPNLLRQGIDLTFRNESGDPDLLYLDVTNMRVGINSNPPTADLEITGTSKVNDNFLVTGTDAVVDNIIIGTNGTFSTVVGPINITPNGVDAYVQYGRVLTTDFELETNYIQVTSTNQNLRFDPAGTGKVDIQSPTDITGNLNVTGNITATNDIQLNGQLIIGDSPVDTVTVNPDFTQTIVPNVTDTHDLGSPAKRWAQIWIGGIVSDSLTTGTLTISGETSYNGNTIGTILSNSDLNISPDTGITHLENLDIQGGTITNTALATDLILAHTGNGYLKLADTNAMKIPAGTNAERVGTHVGETRWNTDQQYLECFDGTVWQVATGGGVVVTPAIMEELSRVYTLVFG